MEEKSSCVHLAGNMTEVVLPLYRFSKYGCWGDGERGEEIQNNYRNIHKQHERVRIRHENHTGNPTTTRSNAKTTKTNTRLKQHNTTC